MEAKDKIEVGDVVRYHDPEYHGVKSKGVGVVESQVGLDIPPRLYRVKMHCGTVASYWDRELTLIRKARKPEQKKRDDAWDALAYSIKHMTEQKKEEQQMFKVGDRVEDTEARGGIFAGGGTVVSVDRYLGGYPVLVRHDNHDVSVSYTADGRYWKDAPVTLKKKEAAMSKKPELSEINERTLVKLRHGDLAFISMNGGAREVVSRHCVDKDGVAEWECSPKFAGAKESDFDIIAVKQMDGQKNAIQAVIRNTEPAWDWTEDMDKPQFKVGDWVEIVDGPIRTGHPVGTRGVIVKNDGKAYKPLLIEANGRELWHGLDEVKPCPPPAPVEITQEEILRQYDKGAGVRLVLKSQSIEVK